MSLHYTDTRLHFKTIADYLKIKSLFYFTIFSKYVYIKRFIALSDQKLINQIEFHNTTQTDSKSTGRDGRRRFTGGAPGMRPLFAFIFNKKMRLSGSVWYSVLLSPPGSIFSTSALGRSLIIAFSFYAMVLYKYSSNSTRETRRDFTRRCDTPARSQGHLKFSFC